MRRVVLCTVICAWAALTVPVLAQEEVRVEIDAGELAGVRQGGITMFKGIPYAAPPVGPLRWRP
ncbi:MAG TPA: carboxylesterase, partial [Acidobacteria bacterium]|nr:carboxylesterase [Acidobacteriota bacterium]